MHEGQEAAAEQADDTNGGDVVEEEEVDINIHNVVSHFSTCCHLNLRQIANHASNVIYKRDQAMVLMKLRRPQSTATIWSSGKIIVTGATSEPDARIASRRVARILQKLGFKVRFRQYRIVNVLGIVKFPFGIRIAQFTEEHRTVCSYEPELHPGATYRWTAPKEMQPDYNPDEEDSAPASNAKNGDSGKKKYRATFKIFQTGAITITAPNVAVIEAAVHHIYPLVGMFKKDKPKQLSDTNVDTKNGSRDNKRKRTKNSDSNNNGNRCNKKKKGRKRRRLTPHDIDDDELAEDDLMFIGEGDVEDSPLTSGDEMSSDDDDTSSDSD